MNDPKLKLTQKLKVLDEDSYIENVDYHMRVLSLLSEKEVEDLLECWSCIDLEFLMEVFIRMFSENSILMQPFKGLPDCKENTLKDNKDLKKHNENMKQTFNIIVEDIKNPNSWMLEIFKISTIHMLYGVGPEHFKSFKRVMMKNLKESLAENQTPEKEKICDTFFECVISFMNQLRSDDCL